VSDERRNVLKRRNKVIPIRKAKQRSDLSVEDEDFDPTSTFKQVAKDIELDPFDTTIAAAVIPELAEKQPEPETEPEPEPEPEVPAVVEPVKPVEVPTAQEPARPEPKVLEIDGKPFKILPPTAPRRGAAKRPVVAAAAADDDDFDPRA